MFLTCKSLLPVDVLKPNQDTKTNIITNGCSHILPSTGENCIITDTKGELSPTGDLQSNNSKITRPKWTLHTLSHLAKPFVFAFLEIDRESILGKFLFLESLRLASYNTYKSSQIKKKPVQISTPWSTLKIIPIECSNKWNVNLEPI